MDLQPRFTTTSPCVKVLLLQLVLVCKLTTYTNSVNVHPPPRPSYLSHMADTIPVSALPTTPQVTGGAYGQVWWCRGPQPTPFSVNGQSYLANVKSGLITSPYATVADVFAISIGEDQQFDYSATTIATWLSIGAAKVNEFLGQRFNVPLTVWSDTVVWANCELTFIGATRKRGINTEAMLADFQAREAGVLSWLKMARDHEITPDQRLSTLDQPQQALQYRAQPARGWDIGSGGLGGGGAYGIYTPSPYSGNGAIGRYGAGGRGR